MENGFTSNFNMKNEHLEQDNAGFVTSYYDGLRTALESISPVALGEIVSVLKRAAAQHKMIYIAGNGGSAATASHMACDLAKGTRIKGFPFFRAISLNDSIPQLTAWANDTSYDNCFSGQLEGLGQPGDVLIVISGSGNSANVLRAVESARELGITTIGFIGFRGGKLLPMVDHSIVIPADNIETVEDAHMSLVHSIAMSLRSSIRASLQAQEEAAQPRELAAASLGN